MMKIFNRKKNQNQQNPDPKKMREIIIKTDGTTILIQKAQVSGTIEFAGILKDLLNLALSGALIFKSSGKVDFAMKAETEVNKQESEEKK